jgi:hypothetical protein
MLLRKIDDAFGLAALPRHPMSRIVNLLLLLSALLSALTGVGGSVRAQDRAQAVAEGSVAAARVASAPRNVTQRPEDVVVTVAQAARAGLDAAFKLAPIEAAFATRRRE